MAKRLRVTSIRDPETGEEYDNKGEIPGQPGSEFWVPSGIIPRKPIKGEIAKKSFDRLKGIEQEQLLGGTFVKEHQSVTGKSPVFSGGSRGSK